MAGCSGFSQGNDSAEPISLSLILWGGNSRLVCEGGQPLKRLVADTGTVFCGVVLVSLVAASGCTICPNPYDYSGPVPNGSVTQNNFCARSGGIRPLGNSPLVWPQVVQNEGAEAAGDTELSPEQAEESSVLLATADDAGGHGVVDAGTAELRNADTNSGVIVTSAETPVDEEARPRWRRLLR